jgi:small subunit ribosomal protein S17
MPRKKKEEVEETQTEASQSEGTEETTVQASAGGNAAEDTEVEGSPSILDSVIDTVSSVVGSVAEAVTSGVSTVVSTVSDLAGADKDKGTAHSKRAEKVGVVSSDKMTKTVVVRVDRVVKHPVYRKYIKRKKKFMAHDEHGAAIGDKVRIMETRPLSARKRWRVVEIIQKAEK